MPTETKAFDLSQKIQYFTSDSIGDIAFGEPIGFLRNDTDMYDYLKTSAEGFPFFVMLSLFPWLMNILSLDFVKKHLPSAKDSVGMGRIMGLVIRPGPFQGRSRLSSHLPSLYKVSRMKPSRSGIHQRRETPTKTCWRLGSGMA